MQNRLTLVDAARDGHRASFLLGSSAPAGVVSPYYQRKTRGRRHLGRNIKSIPASMKCIVYNLAPQECDYNIYDGVNVAPISADFVIPNVPNPSDFADIAAAASPMIITKMAGLGYTISASDIIFPGSLVSAPSSYQTIVSQTGTAAPAVSGSLTPASTYPSGTTFTWARTGAGVYTLTASTAVFTSGKTGVFVGGLNNLNASYKAVVTSSTVITLTTAIGSLLGLGLLGLTATNTDALLANTMIYVQTYP